MNQHAKRERSIIPLLEEAANRTPSATFRLKFGKIGIAEGTASSLIEYLRQKKPGAVLRLIEDVASANGHNAKRALGQLGTVDLLQYPPEFEKKYVEALAERLDGAQYLKDMDFESKVPFYKDACEITMIAINALLRLGSDGAEAVLFKEWEFESSRIRRMLEAARKQFPQISTMRTICLILSKDPKIAEDALVSLMGFDFPIAPELEKEALVSLETLLKQAEQGVLPEFTRVYGLALLALAIMNTSNAKELLSRDWKFQDEVLSKRLGKARALFWDRKIES